VHKGSTTSSIWKTQKEEFPVCSCLYVAGLSGRAWQVGLECRERIDHPSNWCRHHCCCSCLCCSWLLWIIPHSSESEKKQHCSSICSFHKEFLLLLSLYSTWMPCVPPLSKVTYVGATSTRLHCRMPGKGILLYSWIGWICSRLIDSSHQKAFIQTARDVRKSR